MRKTADSLNQTFQFTPTDFIHQQCKQNWHRKQISICQKLSIIVFLNAVQKSGSDQNCLKYFSPAHWLPKMPSRTLKFLKAIKIPYMGLYLNSTKYTTGKNIIAYKYLFLYKSFFRFFFFVIPFSPPLFFYHQYSENKRWIIYNFLRFYVYFPCFVITHNLFFIFLLI